MTGVGLFLWAIKYPGTWTLVLGMVDGPPAPPRNLFKISRVIKGLPQHISFDFWATIWMGPGQRPVLLVIIHNFTLV